MSAEFQLGVLIRSLNQFNLWLRWVPTMNEPLTVRFERDDISLILVREEALFGHTFYIGIIHPQHGYVTVEMSGYFCDQFEVLK